MKLIDADDFLERIENDTDLCAEMERDGLNALKNYLDLQPTAYDIDKVMEQLRAWTFNADVSTNDYEQKNCNLIESANAIEIVKAGGVDGKSE